MKFRHLLCLAAAGLALNQPALAADNDPFDKLEAINPELLFRGVIREDDVTLLFQHMRESMAAAARGEETKESEALNKRAEAIGREVAVRGGVLMSVMLDAFESAAKQMVREGFSDMPRASARLNSPYPRSSSGNY
jgi:hypothetical protein